VVVDITAQRAAEERERAVLADAVATNLKFRAFFEQGALFAGIMDVDGTIIEPNRLSWEGSGFTRDQIVDKPFWDGPWWTPSPALVRQVQDASVRAAQGELVRMELPYYVADGTARLVDLSIIPIKDEGGRVIFLAPTGSDITNRKRAEEALGRKVEEMQTLLDTLPIGVFIAHDPEARLITGNPAAHRLLRTRSPNLSKTADPDERPMHFRVCRNGVEVPPNELPVQRAARGEVVQDMELDDVFDDGMVLHTIMSAAPLYDEQGHVRGAVASVLDVTDRKRAEEALREADRRKDEFLATLSHELRNPLAPLLNGLHLMRMATDDAATMDRARTMMERQLAQLVRLVDDLLDVSRISQGKLELRKARVDLASVLNSAVETSRFLIDEMGHTLEVTMPDEPVYLDADLTRLAQVFMNLLNNAAKYSDRGGRIRLVAKRVEREIVVSVRDTGIGIAADQLPQIFEVFSQVTRSLERSRGGLGIGLSLVRRLLQMHGGTIEARSEGPGHGSEFVVRLPVEVQAPAPPARVLPELEHPDASFRILVVDDNRDSADSLSMMLGILGNKTQTAYDGEEAARAAAAFQPHVILLDIGLPKLNGYETCRRIREQPGGRDVVIVAQTGWGQEEDRKRSREAGFDHHMVKPIDPSALVALLSGLSAKNGGNGGVPQ
ncbi:MAG: PAS domain S-box protein, partial [Cytophagaceae bacterium]|nr:PAS domain S-box protein [Gemmatimonadaceae bacterium]